tara:strand:+ start:184 stop:372 length:189 start_codon:yes stop_codon:yes gene_type:complete
MGHIRLTAAPELPFMCLFGIEERPSNAVDLIDLKIAGQIASKRVDAFRNRGLYISTPAVTGD